MPIDWFTVSAQIINFLILVWLLKRFLYRPILNAVEKREDCIAQKLRQAEEQQVEAQKIKDEYELLLYQWQQDREQRLFVLEEELKQEKMKLMQEINNSYEDLKNSQKQIALREFEALSLDLGKKLQKEVMLIVRNVLKDLACQNLEDRMIECFLDKIRKMDQESFLVFKKLIGANKNEVYFRTAFSLAAQKQNEIKSVVDQIFKIDLSLCFEVHEGLVGGVELVIPGYKISWNEDDYLKKIEDRLKHSLEVL